MGATEENTTPAENIEETPEVTEETVTGVTVSDVKKALSITGDYQNDTIQIYLDEVKDYLIKAGVKEKDISKGIVARGVADLWNYGAGEGKLSSYFHERAAQLALSYEDEES